MSAVGPMCASDVAKREADKIRAISAAADRLGIHRLADELHNIATRLSHAGSEKTSDVALQALRIIAGREQCIDNLMSHAEIAAEALRLIEGLEQR